MNNDEQMATCPLDQTATPEELACATFFQNTACPYFPCHEGVSLEVFNCMLCYCPLYALGEACGGGFTYTEGGVKDCSNCTLPHQGTLGIERVKQMFPQIEHLAQR